MTLATSRFVQYGEALTQSLLYSPLFFAGFAMLTEPLTAPQAKGLRLAYGVIVGVLSSPNIHIMDYCLTSEIALLIGNVLAWVVQPERTFNFPGRRRGNGSQLLRFRIRF